MRAQLNQSAVVILKELDVLRNQALKIQQKILVVGCKSDMSPQLCHTTKGKTNNLYLEMWIKTGHCQLNPREK